MTGPPTPRRVAGNPREARRGLASIVVLAGAPVLAQDPVPDQQVRAARRTALLMSRSNLRPAARPTTSVVGSIWSPDEVGVPNVADDRTD